MFSVSKLAFIENLKKLPYIEAIYLYGSRARGDASERSDIDLAIEAPNATQKDWNHIAEIIENADTLLKIDYVDFLKVKSLKLGSNIQKDHQLIFKRS